LLRAELADQPGRVPGRALGQAGFLQQHDVFLAGAGEMKSDTGADYAPANNDDASAARKRLGHAGFLFEGGKLVL